MQVPQSWMGGQGATQQQQYGGAGGQDQDVDRLWGISRKKNESIWVFKGTPNDYKDWRDRIMDHCSLTNRGWRSVLEFAAKQDNPITFAGMQGRLMDGAPLDELSRILFDWICMWIPKKLYVKRVQLAGHEFGNGFELWRRLRIKYEGKSDICDVAGVDLLHTFPKCKSTKPADMEEHLDDWEEMVDLYGQQLQMHAPMSLRVMLLRTLPKEVEDEILDRPLLRTMEQIIEYLREKLMYKNQKALASFIRPSSQRMNALRKRQEEESDDDDDDEATTTKTSGVQQSIAALTETVTQLVAAVGKGSTTPRSGSPAARKPKFVWKGGCHECGGDHMKRDCAKWKKLMEENGNKIPEGHVNAYTRARDAHNKKHGITSTQSSSSQKRSNSPKDKAHRRANIKALLAEFEMDSDFSGSESDGSNTEYCRSVEDLQITEDVYECVDAGDADEQQVRGAEG